MCLCKFLRRQNLQFVDLRNRSARGTFDASNVLICISHLRCAKSTILLTFCLSPHQFATVFARTPVRLDKESVQVACESARNAIDAESQLTRHTGQQQQLAMLFSCFEAARDFLAFNSKSARLNLAGRRSSPSIRLCLKRALSFTYVVAAAIQSFSTSTSHAASAIDSTKVCLLPVAFFVVASAIASQATFALVSTRDLLVPFLLVTFSSAEPIVNSSLASRTASYVENDCRSLDGPIPVRPASFLNVD